MLIWNKNGKEKTRKHEWLIAKGYRLSTIPPIVTWHAIDKNTGREWELRGRTDDYTLNLYRGKGFVLDRKSLDPQLWFQLEYMDPKPQGDRRAIPAFEEDPASQRHQKGYG
ncbi:hypothetical protein M1N24_02560 [Dehalococcoidia bacterium]|nr:hypothetical protein [Dehalococcoidia bacterium]